MHSKGWMAVAMSGKDSLHTRNSLYWEFYNAIVLE